MPSKRVSLKGKGADLFFGGEQQQSRDDQVVAEQPEEQELPPPLEGDQDTETEPTVNVAENPRPAPSARRSSRRSPTRQSAPEDEVGDLRDMSPVLQADRQSVHMASKLASAAPEVIDGVRIDAIRRVVKVVGRDVSFVRLSPEEKRRLAGIVFTYKMQGIKTSENEINRIAINLLLEDYESNGEQSVLARVLAALQA